MAEAQPEAGPVQPPAGPVRPPVGQGGLVVGQSRPVAGLGRIAGWLALVCAALGLALASRIPPYQVDDAYINYRYATNVAAGKGFSYSPGQAPVEGFTSPLWLLGLVAAARTTDSQYLPWCATLAGLLSFLFILWVIGRSSPRSAAGDADPNQAASAWVPACLFALLPTAITYAVTGLETLLFAAVVVVFAMSLAEEMSLSLGLIAAALALWVRPEGGWLLVAGLLQRLAMGRPARLLTRRTVLCALMVVLGAVTLVAFRLAVFGDLLPNTYYAKTPSVAAGLDYVARTFATPPLVGLLACAVLGAYFGGGARRGYLAAGVAWVAAAILEGGDWMGGGRLLLPALTMFVLAAGGVVTQLSRGGLKSAVTAALVLATLGSEAALGWHITGTAARSYDTYRYEDHVLIDWVRESRARSIALIDIGEMGFRTGIEITDLGGLTDRVIARSPGHLLGKQVDLGYLFDDRAPDLILLRLSRAPEALTSIAPTDAMSVIEGRVLADGRLARDYEPLFLQLPVPPRRPLNARVVYLRKGVQIAAAAAKFRGVISIQR